MSSIMCENNYTALASYAIHPYENERKQQVVDF